MKLLPPHEAEAIALSARYRAPAERRVATHEALWRLAAETVRAGRSLPERQLAAMDGYAVRSVDVERLGTLRLVGEARPGEEPKQLGEGEAIYVHMGAPLPEGADAVARVEATRVSMGTVRPLEPIRPGKDVIRVGEIVEAGEIIVERGRPITPYAASLLLMLGLREVAVYEPRIGVLAVGDEIGRFDEPLSKPVLDSLSPLLLGLLRFARPRYLGVAPDSKEAIASRISEQLTEGDGIIIIGGASVGSGDVVKDAMSMVGELLFAGVSASLIKRSGLAVAEGKPIVSLPAQCVSLTLSFHWLFLTVLSKMVGGELREFVSARLGESVEVNHRMDATYLFSLRGDHAFPLRWGSGVCRELLRADAFGILSRGKHEKGKEMRLQRLLPYGGL